MLYDIPKFIFYRNVRFGESDFATKSSVANSMVKLIAVLVYNSIIDAGFVTSAHTIRAIDKLIEYSTKPPNHESTLPSKEAPENMMVGQNNNAIEENN